MTSEIVKEYRRCNTCQGRKKYAPLGHIEHKCVMCDGIGYASVKRDDITLSAKPSVVEAETDSESVTKEAIRRKTWEEKERERAERAIERAARAEEVNAARAQRMKAYHEQRRIDKMKAEAEGEIVVEPMVDKAHGE